MHSFIVVLLTVVSSVHADYYFPGTTGSYALFRKWHACMDSTLSFEFRTRKPDGLMFYMDDGGQYDFFEVKLVGGTVVLFLNIVDGRDGNVRLEMGSELNNNEWHKLEIIRNRMETKLAVDGEVDGKVSFGSDFHFGDIANNSYVYFGGLPNSFRGHGLHKLALPSAFYEGKFAGYLRNIMISNCTCEVTRMDDLLNGIGVVNDPPESCQVRNPCKDGCVCVSMDQDTSCDCSQADCNQDKAPAVHYHLPFDLVQGSTLVNPSGLDAEIKGRPVLVRGVAGNAIQLDGKNNYVRIVGPGHRYECFGDLQLCDNGYTMGMWINITDPGFSDVVYLSNGGHTSKSHGVAMMYRNGHLEMRFRQKDGREWRVKTDDILPYHWYHVAATWSTQNGLKLFVNGDQVDHDPNPTLRDPRDILNTYNNFLLGRPNDGTVPTQEGTILMDEFHFWSEEKTPKQVRNSGPFYKFFMDMNWLSSSGVLHRSDAMLAQARGGPRLVRAKIGSGLQTNGNRQYVEAGVYSDECLGNINMCWYGLTLGVWINVPRIQNGAYLIYTGRDGLSLLMDNDQLVGRYEWNNRRWEVRYPNLKAGQWYFVELTWNQLKGVKMYVNLKEVASRVLFNRSPNQPEQEQFFLARSPSSPVVYADAILDDLELWYGWRQDLIDTKFILRGEQFHFFFDFNAIDGNQVRLGADSGAGVVVTVHGSPAPTITHGRIFGALNLQGQNQYVTFNQNRHICFSNINYCYFGFLISFWLKIPSLQNNAYYVSTGMNGLNMIYKDGKLHIEVQTWTRIWQMSTDRPVIGRWQYLEVDWDPYYGISLWLDLKKVHTTSRYRIRDITASFEYDSKWDNFYLGRGNVDMKNYRYANMLVDYMHYYYASRRFLLAHGWILRAQPTHFYFGFDSMTGSRIAHPTVFMQTFGQPKLVQGKLYKGLMLDGNSQYVNLGDWNDYCFGNLQHCHHGYTWSAYLNFLHFENYMFYYSTGLNSGFTLFYRDGFLNAMFTLPGVVWRINYPVIYDRNGLEAIHRRKWYFVELSWHPHHGLNMYLDQKFVATSDRIQVVGGAAHGNYSSYIGRANEGDTYDGKFNYAQAMFDEMEVWYGRREELLAHGFLIRGQIDYVKIPFEEWRPGRLDHSTLNITLYNDPTRWPGKIGESVYLNGVNQYVDLGDNGRSCLGSVDLCTYGQTVVFWLNPKNLQDESYVLSSRDYDVFVKNGRLYARYIVGDRKWEVSTDEVRASVWQRVDVTWHPDKGLSLYVDDNKVDEVSTSVPVVPTQRQDTHVYIGRTSDMTNKNYFKGIIDELDVWYAPRSHLVANDYFKYADVNIENVNRKIYVFERIENDKVVNDYKDNLVVYGQPVIGRGRDGTAIILDGINDYIDLGPNVTCQGDLRECFDGFTVLLLMKANSIRDKQYILSGNNFELFFENGKIVGKAYAGHDMWLVQSNAIQPGKWHQVSLSWYQADGLHLYVDCVKRAHSSRARPVFRDSAQRSHRFYIGRANTDMRRERYGDIAVEKFQIWQARRDYMNAYGLLRGDCDATVTVPSITDRPDPYIQCTGNSVIDFDTSRNNYRRNTGETLTIQFKPQFRDGLLWYTENDSGKMYISLKNRRVVVDFDYRVSFGPARHTITSSAGQLDDSRYHKLQIRKRAREVTITVDDRYVDSQRLLGDFYFRNNKRTYLCGTRDTDRLTNYEVDRNYVGFVNEARLEGDPPSQVIDYLRLISQRPLDPFVNYTPDLIITPNPDGGSGTAVDFGGLTTVPTVPPVVITPTATFFTDDSVVKIEQWDAHRTGSLEFRFKTSEPEGLMVYNGPGLGNRDFVALELYDGNLYLVANIGGKTHREKINPTSPVNDGVYHSVKIEHDRKKFISTVDGVVKEMFIAGQDETLDLETPLFIGGIDDYKNIPWDLWTRKGYKGCIRDMTVNFVKKQLKQYADHQRVKGLSFGTTCGQPALVCNSQTCYDKGKCINYWSSYRCDCSGTRYTNTRCDQYAAEITFNGDKHVKVDYTRGPHQTHTNDISVRFRTRMEDGLILTSDSRDRDYIRLCLENGRAKLTVKDRSTVKSVLSGLDLNDHQWHTAYIKRRAEFIEFWIDGQLQHVIETIPKREFYIDIKDIYLGRLPPGQRGRKGKCERALVGQIQNPIIDWVPVFDRLDKGDFDGSGIVVTYGATAPSVKPPTFDPVKFVTPDTFVAFDNQPSRGAVSVSFMFKTTQDDALLFYTRGPGADFIAMELVDGWLHYVYDNGGGPRTERIRTAQRLNDNAWHRVELELPNRNRHVISVDGTVSTLTRNPTSLEWPKFTGRFFVGGVPASMFTSLPSLINSRDGFKGCFSSWFVNQYTPDLLDTRLTRHGQIQKGCREFVDYCNPDPCKKPGAFCVSVENGFYCDCNMTAHVTVQKPDYCGFEAEGFRFGKRGGSGVVTYVYPTYKSPSSTKDKLAVGFMTWMKDGVIFRAEGKNVSGIPGNFLEMRLEDGYVVTEYRFNGGYGKIYDRNQRYNDGNYHVVRFERENERSRMYVDNFPVNIITSTYAGGAQVGSVTFADQAFLYAGGRRDGRGNIYSAFDGIVAGVYWNGFRLIDWAINNNAFTGDVFVAPHLFNIPRPGGVGSVIGGPVKGSAGSVLYPAPGPAAATTSAAATTAGIILGILAALLLLLTALIWAFYKCKPGWLPCVSPIKKVAVPPEPRSPDPGTLYRIQSPPPLPSSQVVSIAPEVRVESFLITANGRYVVTGSSMGPPQIWDVRTGDLIRSMTGDRMGTTDVHLACNESLLAALVTVEKVVDKSTIDRRRRLDMRLQLWDFESGQPLEMPSAVHATASCLMNDRDRLILGFTQRHGAGVNVVMWDLGGNQLVNSYDYYSSHGSLDAVAMVAVTNDDRYAVAGFENLINGDTNYVVFELRKSLFESEAPPLLYSARCDPECTVLLHHHEAITGNDDGELVVWSLRTGKSIRTWGVSGVGSRKPHSDRITAMYLSKDYLVVASADRSLTVWDVQDEAIKYRLVGHQDEVWCCTMTMTQDLVISGSRDNTIRLWKMKDGSEISSFNALMDIFSLKISHDKRVIVALGDKHHSRKLIMLQVLHSRHPKHRRTESGSTLA